MTKYLSEVQILEIIGEITLPLGFGLMSQDSYNEELIAKKISIMKNPPELAGAALNMAIVGYGNRRYGMFRIQNQVIPILDVFKKYGILYQNEQGAVLRDDDITPQRLCRFYRHFIRKYINETKFTSYLWRKYSTRDPNMMKICFRGAEYLEDLTQEEAIYLLNSVKNMDAKIGTHIQERVIRVFEAKGHKVS